MEKEKIILIEVQEKNPEIREYYPEEGTPDENTFSMSKGLNIRNAYDYEGNQLVKYDYASDKSDLSGLKGKTGYRFVIVSRNKFNDYIWKNSKILEMSDDIQIIRLCGFSDCTEEDTKFLDVLYPNYREECKTFTNKKFS